MNIYNRKLINFILLFVSIMLVFSSCNYVQNSDSYKELKSKYEDLSKEYDYIKDEKEELESLYDVTLDELINNEERIEDIEESFRKYIFPQFKDDKIREPGEIWSIGNDFSMYMEEPNVSEIYCRYKLGDGAMHVEDSKAIQAYYSFIYENEMYNETHYDFYQMIDPEKPNKSGYYQGEIYFGTGSKDIYVETIVVINFKIYATTFHIEYP